MAKQVVLNEEAEELLGEVAELQTAFWTKLYELEELLVIEIDGTQDLDGMTVAELLDMKS